jgi:thioredoxin reductase (NADPH)
MSNESIKIDIAVIGAGPAGYSAAVYAVRAGFSVALWMGPEPGGQLTTTNEVENFIGFPEGILGPELMERSKKQCERLGVNLVSGSVAKVIKTDGGFKLESGSQSGEARAVIIATGAVAKWLGTPSEAKFKGKGVSGCATCDGFFFKGKNVGIVGAGDVAMEDAHFLSRLANSVTIFVRKGEDGLKASKAMYERAKQDPKIKFMFNTEVDEFLGDTVLKSVRLKNNITNQMTDMPLDGVFIAIGHSPNAGFVCDLVECEPDGYIKVDGTRTNIPGIFAAGDVADRVYRQAITSAGTGCMAALDAKKWLEEQKIV